MKMQHSRLGVFLKVRSATSACKRLSLLGAVCLITVLNFGCESPEEMQDARDPDAETLQQANLNLGGPRLPGLIDIGKIDSSIPKIPIDPLVNKLTGFAPCDMNGDGIDEIDDIRLLPFENPIRRTPVDGRLVLVLVEPRLLDPIPGSVNTADDVLDTLERYKSDLRAEGLHSRFIEMTVYEGSNHQDGRTLLAMRELLKEVRADYSNLEGVVLVGSFPEAMLVRRWVWRINLKKDEKVNIGGVDYQGISYLRIVPERVAGRAEIVLADLDGNWHNIYEQGPMGLESIEAIPTAAMGNDWPRTGWFESATFDDQTETFEDFFWIRDDNYIRSATNNGNLRFYMFENQRNPEMNADDLSLPNPIARPEIFVSRINPRHVAVNPDPSFLDAAGVPQSIYSSNAIDLRIKEFFHRDAELERRVLLDYFSRNHTYRRGGFSDLPARTSAIRSDKGIVSPEYLNTELKNASSAFGASLTQDEATLVDYVEWFKDPAVMRGISAHSSPWSSAFGNEYDTSDLENAVGNNPWRWKKSGNWYTPSLADQGTAADLYLHRTIWENGILEGTGANLFIHVGCNANSPEGADSLPYNDKRYGTFQNAEGILFYMNGLAIMTRAKGFFDAPRNFGSEIGKSERNGFGHGWRGYFDADANDAKLSLKAADNKKTYFWSVVGDWTVRANYENGLAALGVSDSKMRDKAVHADRSWAEGWNYDAAQNRLAAKGDFDGDGAQDILVTSDWGIGILSADGTGGFEAKLVKPNDTWFGGWRYSSKANTIEGAGDFDGDGADEIVITSDWGIGILDFDGTNMTSLVAKPKDTWFGSWRYQASVNSGEDRIEGVGDFDGNGKDDILITSSWGIGVLTLYGSSMTSLVAKPKDTWFGSWRYQASVNSGEDHIEGIGDFDGDGSDDVLITSSWGIGILKKWGSSFTSTVAKPKDTWFGSWRYQASVNSGEDHIEGIGDFDGDGSDDVLITSSWGIGILKKWGSSFTSIVAKPNGTWFGGWNYSSGANDVEGVGDFDGNGKDDIFITSPWGVGVLRLSGSSLWSSDEKPHGSVLGNWLSERGDRYAFVGDFDGEPGEEILVQK